MTLLHVNTQSTEHFALKSSGGKGKNLYLLSKAGFNVPKWLALGPKFMDSFLSSHGFDQKIDEILSKHEKDLSVVSKEITDLFDQTSLSPDLSKEIIKAYKTLQSPLVAVRSSAIDEDSGGHSFAGQLDSFLYIKSEEKLLSAVKDCWKSGFSFHALTYRQENGIPLTEMKIAVVIQEMILSEKSGVLFTCDPVNQKNNILTINSVLGVGEGLVGGHYDGDTYFLTKKNGEIISQEDSSQEMMMVQDSELESIKEIAVPANLKGKLHLNEDDLKKLYQLALKVEDFYHFPQDIEWAFYQGELYLLQSRPVTTPIPAQNGSLFIWDNSNIVESYGGLTLPLTFGFAHYVYHQVYVQFCEILMVPQKNIKEMDYFLKNMLGLFYGRVYYNLLNWYKLTNILPGYKFNRKFMETMMGTDTSLEDEIAEKIRPPAFQNSFGARIRKVFTGVKFFYFHLNIQNIVDDFIEYFYSVYNQFLGKDYERLSADQIYEDYMELERTLLWKWHAPIINDFLCMVHFGLFRSLSQKWLSHLGDNFHNDLLAGNGNLESAEPTKVLISMASDISKEPELKKLILNTDADECMEAVSQSEFKDFFVRVTTYIERFGFRCMSEMKLEQKDLHQDPSLLFVFLKNLINSCQIDVEEYEKREKSIREKAEADLENNISGFKKLIFKWSLKHARKAVRNRENTRFCRTRIYGIVRSMFYAMGSDFVNRQIIENRSDIFYLTLEELKGSLEGTNTVHNLNKLIQVRKEEYAHFAQEEEPAPRFHTRGPAYWLNQHFPVVEHVIDDSDLKENQMKGLGCSPGIIEGVAKVIMSPDDDLELNGEILVTYRTDPGWIPLYPSASGLLVERGGLLSHSAVVAREMGLPTVVSIKGLTKKIKTGMKIRFNGETGLIEILD